ncbi:CLUMA_CG017026, isoform A [Clunio marinus]|uniref:CLUMA_CG017026, isoform A n=1 Tax=Clunio marinus TaxID=568069 RepID=A0A1J1IUW8_9DIPT|nr:CLUMA_CG017026, isoform A [Clunio marinus]
MKLDLTSRSIIYRRIWNVRSGSQKPTNNDDFGFLNQKLLYLFGYLVATRRLSFSSTFLPLFATANVHVLPCCFVTLEYSTSDVARYYVKLKAFLIKRLRTAMFN